MGDSASPPSSGVIVESLKALRDDAQAWTRFRDKAALARDIIAARPLGLYEFSLDAAELASMYKTLTEKYITALDGAVTNFENVAGALTVAADLYEEEEKRNLHAILKDY